MTAPSPAALRMRRSRERRRQGDAIVSLELKPKVSGRPGLAARTRLRQGSPHACADRSYRAGDPGSCEPIDGLGGGKVCFFCEIKRSTIDTLVELRWLRADQPDDLAAIVTAFRRFVGRWLDIARNGGDVQ